MLSVLGVQILEIVWAVSDLYHAHPPSSMDRDEVQRVKTKPTLEEILAAEAAMPELAALEEAAAENAEKLHIE